MIQFVLVVFLFGSTKLPVKVDVAVWLTVSVAAPTVRPPLPERVPTAMVAELGIACEACHGPGAEHVRLNQNPARRFALQASAAGDPSNVHPERLPVPRRDEICARCHGALVPKSSLWDARTHRDPFIAGQELMRYNNYFWSEAEQAIYVVSRRTVSDGRATRSAFVPSWTGGRRRGT